MIAYGATNVGKIRKNNEDAYLICQDEGVFILADGMGGHKGGEYASAMAVEALGQSLKKAQSPGDIERAIQEVNGKIFEKASQHEELSGMGTTLSVVDLIGPELYFANIGDSRIYQLRGGEFSQLTKDDSYVNYLVDVGAISEAQAQDHPKKNVLLKALGTTEEVDILIQSLAWKEGDCYLLCSDGLSNMLTEEEMAKILREMDPQRAVDTLIDKALDSGGKDNITVIVLLIQGGAQ